MTNPPENDPYRPPTGDQPPHGSYPPADAYQGRPQDATYGGGYAPAPTSPPKPLATAVMLMWAGCALSIISLLSLFFMGDQLGQAMDQGLREGTNGQLTPEQVEQVRGLGMGVGIGFAVFFGLVGAALWAWMAVKNKQGRSWARILATVFGAIGILSGLVGVIGGGQGNPLNLVLNVLNLAIAIGALFFMWKKENNPYYAAMSAPRA